MNCKPGDLAYIIKAEVPQNLGRILEVVGVSDVGTAMNKELTWDCLSMSPLLTHSAGVRRDVWCRDAWLRPIRPQPDDLFAEASF
jgi:hypothetical protein